MATVNGIINWAFLTKADQYGNYSFELLINDTEKDKLTKALPNVTPNYKKDPNTGLWVLKLKRKAVTKDGKPMPTIRLVDSRKTPIGTILGNGSEVNVSLSEYAYTQPKPGFKFNINTVQLVKLVQYQKDGLGIVADGYVGTDADVARANAVPKEENPDEGRPFDDSLDGLDQVKA
jgi:hypothetical protein